MARFPRIPSQPDLDRLLSALQVSDIKAKDNPTFQVISQLIQAVKQLQDNLNGSITSLSSTVTNITGEEVAINFPVITNEFDDSQLYDSPFSIPGKQGDRGLQGLQGPPGMDGISTSGDEIEPFLLMINNNSSSSSGTGLTQPQVCKLVSLRA